jgi:anti-sigma regulatory factor (Ser/Thr protein kinase)
MSVNGAADRSADLVLAVSELAANTLRHAQAGGTLRAWQSGGDLCCEVRDHGTITDPLAGRHAPSGGQAGGQGLWLVNQVCDLVQLRSGPAGTTIRLSMRLPAAVHR